MKETPLRVGYIRIHFNDGTYKDFRKDDENIGIITPEQRKARGYYTGSKKLKTFSEMTEEEQKLFSGDEWKDFRNNYGRKPIQKPKSTENQNKAEGN